MAGEGSEWRKRALRAFLLLSLVSLFGDVVYEGGRSVSGPFLRFLGTPAELVGLVGLGDFLGSVLRFLVGALASYLASSTALWLFTISGYAVTAAAIPLLALAPGWQQALALYVVERLGKGLRAPARDTIISEVSEPLGVGKGFGIHEVLDQVGAFAGPLLVALLLQAGGYRLAFASLALPGAVCVLLALLAYGAYPRLRAFRARGQSAALRGLGRAFWLYAASMGALALGFVHWAVASYWLRARGVLADAEVGLAYSAAMLVDALVAVPIGALYDRVGLRALFILPPLSAASAVLAWGSWGKWAALAAALSWGSVAAAQESVMSAAVVGLVDPSKRPMAYGTLSLVFGACSMAGALAYSWAFASLPAAVPALAAAFNGASLALLIYLARGEVEGG